MKALLTPEGSVHVTIWCKPSQWDKLQYLSAPSCKNVSTWICDTAYNFNGVVKPLPRTKGEQGKVYPLCVAKDKWDKIKQKAEDCEVSISNYVLSACLYQ